MNSIFMTAVTYTIILCSLAGFAFGYPAPLNEAEPGWSSPKPGPYKSVWTGFYNAGTEGGTISALVAGGRKMVPFICRAVGDSKMSRRRYAISALGHLHDRRAILTLETIYSDTDEDSLFRGDALEAIFVIDQLLGQFYADRVIAKGLPKDDYLLSTAHRVFSDPQSMLTLPVPNEP